MAKAPEIVLNVKGKVLLAYDLPPQAPNSEPDQEGTMTERQIQKQAVELFRKAGYHVVVTSGVKRAVAAGIPDLVIHLAKGYCVMADAKSPDGKLTPEQTRMVQEDKLFIFRDAQALLDHCTKMKAGIER